MALSKLITQDDGVTTNYHRIFMLDFVINSHVSITVLSYIDEAGRRNEGNSEFKPYKTGITYEIPYVENMTIEDAYNYLKTSPTSIFEGASDN